MRWTASKIFQAIFWLVAVFHLAYSFVNYIDGNYTNANIGSALALCFMLVAMVTNLQDKVRELERQQKK